MIRYLLVLTGLMIFGSCINEPMSDSGYTGKEAVLGLSVTTRSQTPDEMIINKVRIIVARNGFINFNEVVAPNLSGEYLIRTPYGENDYYIICNETAELTQKLNSLNSSYLIEELTFSPPLSAPFVMVGKINGSVIATNDAGSPAISYTNSEGTLVSNASKISVDVTRIIAKVNLSIIKNSESITKVSNVKVSVNQRPAYCYMGNNKSYSASSDWLTYLNIPFAMGSVDELNANSVYSTNAANNDFIISGNRIDMVHFYIPENILTSNMDKARNTYINITADCLMSGGSTVSAKWRVDFEDNGLFRVMRNTHYKILGVIEGIGPMNLYADIIPVKEVDLTIGWGLIDGLVIVSDQAADYNMNKDVWSNYNALTGILKVYKADSKSFRDVVFKYGSILAIESDDEPYTAEKVIWGPAQHPPTGMNWEAISSQPKTVDIEVNNATQVISEYKGDPCRLVHLSTAQIAAGIVDNNQWRMMTPQEMVRLEIANDAQDENFVKSGEGYYAYHALRIPYMKPRVSADGSAATDNRGIYWTSKGGQAFVFNNQSQSEGQQSIRFDESPQKAATIRCIRVVPPKKTISALSTTNPNAFDFRGDATNGKPFTVTTNIPYWTATVIKVDYTSKVNSNFPEPNLAKFSFTRDGTTVHQISGSETEVKQVYMQRYITNEFTSNYTIEVKGYGLDGNWLKSTVTSIQNPYIWQQEIAVTSANPGFTNNQVPRQGTTVSILLKILPIDADVLIPQGSFVDIVVESAEGTTLSEILHVYLTTEKNYSVPGIQIPANTAPTNRSIYIKVKSTNLPHAELYSLRLIQD